MKLGKYIWLLRLMVALLLLPWQSVTEAHTWTLPSFVNHRNVVQWQDTTVPVGSSVHNLIVIGGNAVVDGVVTDNIVVVNGDVTLGEGAYVKDRVFVFGGHMTMHSGAEVGNGIIHLGEDVTTLISIPLAGILALLMDFVRLLGFVILVVLPALLSRLSGNACESLRLITDAYFVKNILYGLLWSLVLVGGEVALAMTGIGIPIALLLMALHGIACIVGVVGVAGAIGHYIVSAMVDGALVSRTKMYVYGGFALALVTAIPVVGILVGLVCMLAGFGGVCIVLSRRKK